MSYTLESLFSVVAESVMLLNGKGRITWISESEEGKTTRKEMDLHEFVLQSLASTLIEKGESVEEVKKVAENHDIEIDESPYHSVLFQRLGGKKRRFTRRTHKKE
jgi:hypothetical protein